MYKRAIIIFTILITNFCYSQEQTGEITGLIQFENGDPVHRAVITATGSNLVGLRKTESDESGKFRLPVLPPGTYVVRFKIGKFKQVTYSDIKLETGKTLKLVALIEQNVLKGELDIKGNVSVIDVKTSSSTINLPREVFSRLPHKDDFLSLLISQSGMTTSNGILLFEGASGPENTFFVDGINTTDLQTGLIAQQINYDAIDEIQIKSSGSSAEYDGAMGGIVSIITKSGTNEFHGNLSIDMGHSALSGTRKKLLQSRSGREVNYSYDYPASKWFNTYLGLSMGGSLIKDRLHIFATFVPRYSNIKTPQKNYFEPDIIRYSRSETVGFRSNCKLTGTLSRNIKLSLNGSFNWEKLSFSDPAIRNPYNYPLENKRERFSYEFPGLSLAGTMDWLINENLFLNITGSLFRRNRYRPYDSFSSEATITFVSSNMAIPGISDHLKFNNLPGYIDYYQTNGSQRDKSKRYQFNTNLTYNLNSEEEHILKTGISWTRVYKDINKGRMSEYWKFYWKQPDGRYSTYTRLDGSSTPLDYGYVVGYRYGDIGKAQADRIAFYLQDSWTINNNFTINAGLRFETEHLPAFNSGKLKTAFSFGLFDKVAPRIGFSWDPAGDSRNKIFGSFGIYYDVMKLNLSIARYGGRIRQESVYNIKDFDWTKYLTQKSYNWTGDTSPVLGGELLEILNNSALAKDAYKQPGIKPFSKKEFTLGYQRMISDNLYASIRFMFSSVINAVEDIGIVADIFSPHRYIGNPGSEWINRKYAESGYVPEGIKCPPAKRHYTSIKLQIDKKFSSGWFGGISLNLSRLWGNFSGLADTDPDLPVYPNSSSHFNTWYLHYDQNLKETTGLLPTDRPVDLRIYGAFTFNSDLTIGFNGMLKSGTPVSRSIELNSYNSYYPLGRCTDGRTPPVWQIDLYIEQMFRITKAVTISLNMNITNLTNNSIARRIWNKWTYNSVIMTNQEIMSKYNIYDLIRSNTNDPRFLKEYDFIPPLSVRFGAAIQF